MIYELAAQRPPFLAKDMKSLFLKVTKGVFPNIPPKYSGELYFLITKMLTVEASVRPSAEDLLAMPVVAARAADLVPS